MPCHPSSGYHESRQLDDALRERIAAKEHVIRSLTRAFPVLGADAAEDAFMAAIREWRARARPGEVAPPLHQFRLMAWRRARDIAKSERARKEREAEWQSLRPPCQGIYSTGEIAECRQRVAESVCEVILALLPDERMREIFRLRSKGDPSWASFAEALGIQGMPPEQQRLEIEREKDRFRKFVRRSSAIQRVLSSFFAADEQHPAIGMSGQAP